MPENASFQGKFAEVSFEILEVNQLLWFQNGYFYKKNWDFHETHDQVKYR
jgi:hypothetical protein